MPRRTRACATSPPARIRKKAPARGLMTWPTEAPGPPKRSLTTSVTNMAYHIEFADRAARDLEALYVEKNAAESEAASRWYNGMEEAVYALATYPDRCPMAPEARKLRRELRHLLYGKKPHVHRILYEVDERTKTVWFVTVRHGARRRLKAS